MVTSLSYGIGMLIYICYKERSYGYLSGREYVSTRQVPTDTQTEWTDIQPATYRHSLNLCKSTFQFSNLAKYGYGPPEDGFKGGRNKQGRILSVLMWDFGILKCSEVHELEQ
jgi:hypothetical protein